MIPKPKELANVTRKYLAIQSVQLHFIPVLKQKGIIDVDVEIINENFDDCNPNDEGHKGMVDSLGCSTAKNISSINITLITE
jgi:hypothetical protein